MTALRIFREWLERARALRDDRKLREKDDLLARQQVEDRIQLGKRALESGDRATAIRLWEDAHTRYSDLVVQSREGFNLLIGLQKFKEAEALMLEGYERQPRNPFFLEGAAIAATRLGNNDEAVRRYSILRKKFPRLLRGYTGAITPLIKLGRLDEADRILGRIANNARDINIKIEYAKLAMTRKDWPVALQRWKRLWNSRWQDAASLGVAQCHKEMGYFDEAEQVLMDALKRPRQDAIKFWTELALISECRGNWLEAARRWDDLRKRSPSMLEAYCRSALAFGKCGYEAEVDSILHAATQRFPSVQQPWVDYARAAERRGSLDEARLRWDAVQAKFPEQVIKA
jgi:predicted Zn-dependent protease